MRARGLLAVHVPDLVHAELVEGLEVEVEGFVAEVEEGVEFGAWGGLGEDAAGQGFGRATWFCFGCSKVCEDVFVAEKRAVSKMSESRNDTILLTASWVCQGICAHEMPPRAQGPST